MNCNKKTEKLLFAQYPDIMTVAQVRTALGIGRVGVYKLLESGQIKSFKIGHVYKIPKSALIVFIQANCSKKKEGEEK